MNVDPDIRYMAIKDFQKYLLLSPQVSVKNVEKLIPILFHLLKDSNADIQSQTVKTFAPMIIFMTTPKTIDIINKLYELVEKENQPGNSKKITISIPNMALRTIFSSDIKFSYQTSRNVLDSLLPQIIATAADIGMTFDSIEVLTYLIRSVGEVLTIGELRNLSDFLIGVVYNEYGMICKRSLMVLDNLLGYVTEGNGGENEDEAARLINDLVLSIDGYNSKTNRADKDSLSLSLYSIVLKNSASNSSSFLISTSSIQFIWGKIDQALNLNEINVEVDPNSFDYDLLVQQSSHREDGLLLLNTFISELTFSLLEPYWGRIYEYIKAFMKYDPLNFGDNDDEGDDDFVNDLDSDIEFSDDEVNEGYNDENFNDCTWKLRKQSAILLKLITQNFSKQLLSSIYSNFVTLDYLLSSVNDRNDVVSDEILVTLITIFNLTAASSAAASAKKQEARRSSDMSMLNESDPTIQLLDILPILEKRLFENLFIEKKINRFPNFLKLIESITKNGGILSNEFLEKLYVVFQTLNIKTGGNSEYLNLYKAILSSRVEEIPHTLVVHIINDLTNSIKNENSYHNIIMDSLSTAITLFKRFRGKFEVDEIDLSGMQSAIIDKCHNKAYSGDLRQRSISALCQLIYNIKLHQTMVTRSLEVFEESLSYEATVKVTLESLLKVFDHDCVNQIGNNGESGSFELKLIEKFVLFINSLDDSLYYNTLKAFVVVTERLQGSLLVGIPPTTITSLLSFCKIADMKNLLLTFRIFTNLLVDDSVTVSEEFIQSIVGIVDNRFERDQQVEIEYDLQDYELFIKLLCKKMDPQALFNEFYGQLNLDLFISAITLSIISTEGRLLDIIEKFELELASNDNILFNIQFLGVVSSTLELKHTSLSTFQKFFDLTYLDTIKIASAKSIGLYTIRDAEKYLPRLLEQYKEVKQQNRELILVALKEVLLNSSDLGDEIIDQIWVNVWEQQQNLTEEESTNINKAEAKYVGDILSKICSIKKFYLNVLIKKLEHEAELTNSTRYVLIVVLKQLLSNSANPSTNAYEESNSISDTLILQYFLKSLKFFNIMNIPIKQALIGTLLTGLHNKPLLIYPILQDDILPFIYDELEAKLEFRKTIPMGPYKYNIDEGLEIRKLSYEFLYTILSIDINLNSKYGVKYIEIVNNILEKGFKDTENDIIILSSVNLTTFINKSPDILNEQDILEKLIEQITLALSKKLKAKPSKQESESYEECQKSILNLCKIINTILSNSSENKNTRKINIRGGQLQKWNTYYINEVKRNFEI